MADLSPEQLQRLARRGAQAALDELEKEVAAIRKAFPELFDRRRGAVKAGARRASAGGRRRRRGMSAAGRKAVSERMKKYWAKRRKTKAKK